MTDTFSPRPEHKFSFGLWTVCNRGRDPFGVEVRDPLPPIDAAALLGEVGAWGVNLHDNDLVPIDATPADRDRIVKDFQRACPPPRRCPRIRAGGRHLCDEGLRTPHRRCPFRVASLFFLREGAPDPLCFLLQFEGEIISQPGLTLRPHD